ncbi:unnamed protein product [Allacma fusca]|uniref:Peptidase S1 domain-containing protein n=1 Tax=Allacma fusca TaxID=39272 RepID=A0A8J2PEQ5_9HEXA|nr:unnamed protein product [Allacma fusca]
MKIFVVAFLSAWVFAVFSDPTSKGASHRPSPEGRKLKEVAPLIVGGRPAHPNEFPYQISLQFLYEGQWRHVCGGVVVAVNKVLTAAHCVKPPNLVSLRVVAGEHSLAEIEGREQVSGIDTAILHPNYDSRTMDYDYGVLRLSRNLTFNNYGWVAAWATVAVL